MSMSVTEIVAEQQAGRLRVVDLAPPPRFAQSHPAGAISLPFGPTFSQAAHGLPSDQPLLLFAEQPAIAERARQVLEAAGLTVAGVYGQGIDAWERDGGVREGVAQMTVDELAAALREGRGDLTVIDVREPYEWRSGVIPGAVLMSMGTVPTRAGELDRERTIAVVCAHGNRSAQVAAWLGQQGFAKVHNVPGGMALWLGGQHPVEAPPQ
jgi:rhodanese-related sulfurtransferase